MKHASVCECVHICHVYFSGCARLLLAASVANTREVIHSLIWNGEMVWQQGKGGT